MKHTRIGMSMVVGALAAMLAGSAAYAAGLPGPSDALTIYSTARPGAIPARQYRPQAGVGRYNRTIPGYAVVRQERDLMIDARRKTVRFSDVAALIDPTTVSFASLTDPGTRVLEQNYQFDLVSGARLMERYLDRSVTVEQVRGDRTVSITGTLLSTDGGLILRDPQGQVQVLRNFSNVRFPELPGGLITRPTLVWELATDKPGKHRVRVGYQTGGMTWWADYNLTYADGADANHCTLDMGAWVSIINRSGAGYKDAKLKLIAGDVHRVTQPGGLEAKAVYAAAARTGRGEAGFQEKGFFEYHLYTLGRPTTLPDNSTKQIELFPTARGVSCEKKLVYYGLPVGYRGLLPNPVTDRNFGIRSNRKVDVYLAFRNDEKRGLGIPLPAGRVRVSKRDPADGSREFIGEDAIDHTPKDENVLIKMGSAFDVVGERKQLKFRIDTVRKWMEEEIEIKLRNHKEQPVNVVVKENLYRWDNWKITDSSHKFEQDDARTIHFPVRVPKDGEVSVRYTVRYTW